MEKGVPPPLLLPQLPARTPPAPQAVHLVEIGEEADLRHQDSMVATVEAEEVIVSPAPPAAITALADGESSMEAPPVASAATACDAEGGKALHAPPEAASVTDASVTSASDKATTGDAIFVSIAAYRDPEGPWTLHSLFSQADHPERVRVGIVWQVRTSVSLGRGRRVGPPE